MLSEAPADDKQCCARHIYIGSGYTVSPFRHSASAECVQGSSSPHPLGRGRNLDWKQCSITHKKRIRHEDGYGKGRERAGSATRGTIGLEEPMVVIYDCSQPLSQYSKDMYNSPPLFLRSTVHKTPHIISPWLCL